MSKHISVTIDKCIGCHTCELECAIAHSGADDIERMAQTGEKAYYRIHVESVDGVPVPVNCQQCDQPACELACPTGAVMRQAPDQPVLVDSEKCIGCSMCVQACPFGMISMTADGETSYKCDLCVDRANGAGPACVESCPTSALLFIDDDEASREKRVGTAERLVEAQKSAEAQPVR